MVETNHFADGGDKYARRRPSYPPELAKALAEKCSQTDHVLDVGCGSGQLSVLLATYFDQVTATDPSHSQIKYARPHPKINYLVEPAEAMSLPARSVNLVVAAQAAHWFDLDAFYAEVKRIARPNCVLALLSYGVPSMRGDIGERLSRFYWNDIHEFWPDRRKHVETGYQTLDFPFEEDSLSGFAIKREWTRPDLLGYVDTWSAIKRAKSAQAYSRIEQFERDMAKLWPDDIQHHVTWPISARVAR